MNTKPKLCQNQALTLDSIGNPLSLDTMFFPFYLFCCQHQKSAHKTYQEHKLAHLKAMRDGLEAHLASVNAAIETIEGQLQREETTTAEGQSAS